MATSKSDAPGEIAWLIEMTQEERAGRPPIYWGHVEEGEGWTSDVNEAFRFDTQAAADRRGSDVGIPDYLVVEHAWIALLPRHGNQ